MKKPPVIKEVDEIVDKHDARITDSVGILQDIQTHYSYLPREALVQVARRLDIPLSQVFSLATFYKALSLKPRGRHLIIVCMGTACHVRGAPRLVEEIRRRLNIGPGETTEDNSFTLEVVNCLGACALGPLMVIDGEYFGNMSVKKVESVLKRFREPADGSDN